MSYRLAAVALVLGLTTSAAAFHNRLERSLPAADSTVAGSPKEVRLWFTENVEPKFSSITLVNADSAKVEVGRARATDSPKSIAADIAKPLPAGKYLVTWRTAGDDGHAVRGKFSFTVR